MLWHLVRMRIVCPSCSAAYEVAESVLAPGRIVRCARCGEEWVGRTIEAPVADDPEPDEVPDAAVEHGFEAPRLRAMDRLAHAVPLRGTRRTALRVAWAASVVVILTLLWSGYAWRADVMAHWPPSTRLYSMLGLVPPPH